MVKPWLTNGQRDRPVGDDNQALEFRWGATSACQYFSDTAGETYQFSVGYLNPGRPDSRWQPRIQVQWMAADNTIIGQHDGRRGWALHGTYDKKELVHTGPIVKEVIRSGGQLRVIFDSMGSGLHHVTANRSHGSRWREPIRSTLRQQPPSTTIVWSLLRQGLPCRSAYASPGTRRPSRTL